MATQIRLTDNVNYLQRSGFKLTTLPTAAPSTNAPPDLRRLFRINGIGCHKEASSIPEWATHRRVVRLPTEDILIGLHGYNIPLVFLVSGTPDEVGIHLGVWSPSEEKASASSMDDRKAILSSLLNGLYPAVMLTSADVGLALPLSGLALGIPTGGTPNPLDGSLPLDRMIRAMVGTHWGFLILALPMDESVPEELRNRVVNEMRAVQDAASSQLAPGPLAKYYVDLLQEALKALTQGQAIGTWRTGVYLLGDAHGYYRLASFWRGVFSGEESIPEPIRVLESRSVADLAARWALPDYDPPPGPFPGFYRHPFQYQTLLTSRQLAAYIHLPQIETSGFSITTVTNFDAVPPLLKDDRSLELGDVIHWKRRTSTKYRVSLKSLTRHAFVAGATGSGKTNTIFHLLRQTAKSNVHFLVIEPAKTEYRALLDDENLGEDIQIFTLGDELTSPFRLNPFEVVSWPEIPVGVHLDLLRSVFSASFGMWTPLPQILEQCLYGVYKDRGWDIATNTNHRLDGRSEVADAFPTLSDLAAKVDEVIQGLGYEDKITDDMRAALLTRINGLRAGGKGCMLDVQRSLPTDVLLQHSTVLELQGMGDDDDKAFVMGLLLIRLYEYRRAGTGVTDLQHLLIIEEAHRLLTNVGPRRGEEEADPRGKAVETFANLLSEIRAYGQGVIVADQIPGKLAPEIIKNTNLKIAHRVVAADDRMVLAGAMAMDDRQARVLATLTVDKGEAAVFSEGDDAPILVSVPPAKDQGAKSPPDGKRVKDCMSASKTLKPVRMLFQSLLPEIDMSVPAAYMARDAARTLVDDPSFKRDFVRLVVSITEDEGALSRLWDDLIVRTKAIRGRDIDEGVMLHCLMIYASEWFARRRGSKKGLTYSETAELAVELHRVLLAKLENKDSLQTLRSFRTLMYRLHARPFEPFPGCAAICTQSPPVCLYRHAVADLVASSKEAGGEWRAAYSAGGLTQTWDLCQDKAYELIELHEAHQEAIRRIGLCYAQHMLVGQFREIRAVNITGLLKEATQADTGGKEDE